MFNVNVFQLYAISRPDLMRVLTSDALAALQERPAASNTAALTLAPRPCAVLRAMSPAECLHALAMSRVRARMKNVVLCVFAHPLVAYERRIHSFREERLNKLSSSQSMPAF
jgi:hypothetical protein